MLAGDLPRAFARYAEAAEEYDRLGEVVIELVLDRSLAYLAAGLATEAVDVVEAALERPHVQDRYRAELLLMRANAALAAGDHGKAADSGTAARRMFRRQERDWFEVQAELTALSARYAGGRSARSLLPAATALVERMRPLGVPELPQALMLAGRLATRATPDDPPAYFREAAAYRRVARAPHGHWAGSRRPWTGGCRATGGECSAPAAAASRRSTTTRRRWAAPSCARW